MGKKLQSRWEKWERERLKGPLEGRKWRIYFYIRRKCVKTILKTVNDIIYIIYSLTEILILFVEILKFGTAPRVPENQI